MRGQFKTGIQIRFKSDQVPVVDPDDVRSDSMGDFELS